MTSLQKSKQIAPIIQKRIDNHAEIYPSLDYSFHNAQTIEDAFINQPRAPLGSAKPIKEGDLYHSHGINLNHNMLKGPIDTLPNLIKMTLIDPNALTTLDLSFNTFIEIPIVIKEFPLLKYFYFHKNFVANLNEIEKLLPLKELQYVTLQGNPIELNVPYLRSYVICLLPGLKSFNSTPISKGDRNTTDTWKQTNKSLLPKSISKTLKK